MLFCVSGRLSVSADPFSLPRWCCYVLWVDFNFLVVGLLEFLFLCWFDFLKQSPVS